MGEMKSSYPSSSESEYSAARRRGRDRTLSYPMPATIPEPAPPQDAPRQTAHWQLWLMLVVLAALAVAVLIPTLAGIYVGQQERASYLHDRAVDHYKQALAYESEEYNELAIAELQVALKFDPSYEPAAQKLQALQATPVPNGTAQPQNASIADQLFGRAQTAVAGKQWSDAIGALEEIRRADQNYRASEVTTLLIQAYVNAGQQSVAAGQIEDARSHFQAALALDPANAQAKSLADRAGLYLDAVQLEGSDWAGAAVDFQKLYQQDPSFYDVKKQLANAFAQYGDQAAREGASCIAAREYAQAYNLGVGPDVSARLSQANAGCKQAVLAPTATAAALAAAGFAPSARLDPSMTCEGAGSISGTVQDAQGAPVTDVTIRIYNDADYRPAPFIVDATGKYSIVLGLDAGVFHLVVLGADGAPAGVVYNVNYPGGSANGCHWIVDWKKAQ